MTPAYFFNYKTNKVDIMALNKNQENQGNEFEELINSIEASTDNDGYTTITGRETEYHPEYETFKAYEMDIGDYIEGTAGLHQGTQRLYQGGRESVKVLPDARNSVCQGFLLRQ